ncbi:MAG: hypothetical protein FWF68_09955 [Spirochaetes bacterium]|nr:hypothetical protein [Brevinematales bacterium]MCL1959911.1 hypothetical protein [Spirochaetota bacterium]
MKKLAFILMILTAMFAIVSCNPNPDDSEKNFWARNMAIGAYYQVSAEKLAENSRCVVWAEKGSGVTVSMANSVANAYSNTVYQKMMKNFGYTINDPDLGKVDTMQIAHYLATGTKSGAKLTILLLDIKDGYKNSNDSFVAGYFHAINLLDVPQSNKLDMIYLDTYPSVPGSDSSNETLAHEMQHLMNFVSSIVFRYNKSTKNVDFMDIWIDEGLSSAAEWIYSGQHPNVRWEWYNIDKSELIKKGNNFFVWGNRSAQSPLANLDDYATVYLFFQYLRLQSDKPDNIYFDIHTSEHFDYQAVTTAENINSTHKNNWELLLRDWLAANFTNAPSGLYGYKSDSTLKNVKAPMVPGGTTNLPLVSGEGVYSRTSTTGASVPSNSGKLRYAALSSNSGTPSNTTSTGGAQLTYNIDTETDEAKCVALTGSTTGTAPSVGISITDGSGSVQIDQKKFTGPFKVDASYFLRKNGKSRPENEIRSLFNNNNSRSIIKSNGTLRFDKSTVERVFIDE